MRLVTVRPHGARGSAGPVGPQAIPLEAGHAAAESTSVGGARLGREAVGAPRCASERAAPGTGDPGGGALGARGWAIGFRAGAEPPVRLAGARVAAERLGDAF